MARHKAAVNCDIRPWLSARADNREGRFLQIGNSLLLSDRYQALSAGAKSLYLAMAMESGGRKYFVFPQSAAHKYGMPDTSFWRYVAELEKAGFIERQSNKNTRTANDYCFCLRWKCVSLSQTGI